KSNAKTAVVCALLSAARVDHSRFPLGTADSTALNAQTITATKSRRRTERQLSGSCKRYPRSFLAFDPSHATTQLRPAAQDRDQHLPWSADHKDWPPRCRNRRQS